MFKLVQKYEDFLGNERQGVFRFNITESEMLDLMREDALTFNMMYLQDIVEEQDGIKMLDVFRKILVVAYGEMSEDGENFWKDPERTKKFVQSAAFDAILDEFATSGNVDKVRAFMIGVFPKKFAAELSKRMDATPVTALKK
jgi:hypothetical protein